MKKDDIKPAAWGAIGGAIALLIVAFSTGWIVTSSSAREMAEQMTELVSVCRFKGRRPPARLPLFF